MKSTIYFDGDKIRLVPSIPENAVFDSNNILLDDKLKGLLLDMHNIVEEYLTNHPELIFDEEVLAKTNKNVSDLSKEIDNLKLFKFPNTTIVGNPAINHGSVSEFDKENYIHLPFVFDVHQQAFSIEFAFTTGNDVTKHQCVIGSEFGIEFFVNSSNFGLNLSTNGSSWLGAKWGTYTVKPNTTYHIKIEWNKLVYKVSYSTDGVDYIQDISFTLAQQPSSKVINIGISYLATQTGNPFKGIINLNKWYIKINNEVIWQGMDDSGLATRLATDMSNIDEVGESYISKLIQEELSKL